MEVKEIAIEKVIPYARNPRRNDAAVAAVAASIREFGFRQPIVVDEDLTVLVGHTRLKAAQSLGLTKVPVHIAKGLTESQRKAYRIADNKLNDLAVWDDELLALELVDLQNASYDTTLAGFGEEEIAALLNLDGAAGKGEAPKGNLSDRFMLPPFSVLNAREGWWQDRKRAWLALGIKSEVGRGGTVSTSARVGENDEATYRTIGGKRPAAAPGGSARPACDYSKKQRGDGAGRPIK